MPVNIDGSIRFCIRTDGAAVLNPESEYMLSFDIKTARIAWTVMSVPTVVCGIYLLRKTLLIFAIALMFAYLIYPLVELIDRRTSWKTRTPALVIPFLLILASTAGLIVFVGKHVAGEATQLAAQIKSPDFARQVREWRPMNVPVGDQIVEHYSQILGMVPEFGRKAVAASKNLINIFIVPILSFFVLKDGRKIHRCLLGMLPSHRKAVEYILADAHKLMLEYVRSLLLLCLLTFISFAVCLSLMHVPYAILLAAVSFPLEFVPLIGPLASAAIILGVSVFSGYQQLIWVIAFLGTYRIFQDYAVSPHLMSKGVNMHPLLMIFGIFGGGEIGGVAGIFLSVPVLVIGRLAYQIVQPPVNRGYSYGG